MYIKRTITEALKQHGVTEIGFLPFSKANPGNQRLWQECNEKYNTCILLLFPYKTEYTVKDRYSVSAYARTYDYHKRCSEFFEEVIPILNKKTGFEFKGFADHSPISEKLAAAQCGLGVIGKNSLLINKKYGSYVFIATLLTNYIAHCEKHTVTACIGCNKCVDACPSGALGANTSDFEKCLSFISQKKQKNPEELKILRDTKTVWGCDICQTVCPLNQGVSSSNDSYFSKGVLDNISGELIDSMPDQTFLRYPFSWRKRQVISDNIKNCNNELEK